MKLDKAQRKAYDRLVSEAEEAERRLDDAFESMLATIRKAGEVYAEALTACNQTIREVNQFTTEVAENLRDEYDDKSEKWQESEVGSEALAMVEAWENAEMDELEDVSIVEPDKEDPCLVRTLEDLPTES